jgi:hypothetical protein
MYVQKRGFKRKTIAQTIEEKINKWLATIEDTELQKEVKNNYILTGGAIASMLMGDLPNDYDVYIANVDVAEKLALYYVKQLTGGDLTDVKVEKSKGRVEVKITSSGVLDRKDMGKEPQDSGKYRVLLITSNAITLSNNLQIVLRFVGPAKKIHKNYDFVHATNYYTKATGLVLHQEALESILARELKYVGSLYPVCSVFRIKKFINRGWTITAGETLKILFDVSKLDLSNIEVLEEQSTGVDTAYFEDLVDRLKGGGKGIDRTYLFELINDVFDGVAPDEEASAKDNE